MEFTPSKNQRVTALVKAVDINPRVFDPARNLINLRRRLQKGETLSALATLQMTRLTEASDPRDHLFAKIGLSGRELIDLCPPDYDAEPEDIWFTFLSEYIKQKQDLYVECNQERIPIYPPGYQTGALRNHSTCFARFSQVTKRSGLSLTLRGVLAQSQPSRAKGFKQVLS
ncbi:unnamed protein product [Alternaria alternata]